MRINPLHKRLKREFRENIGRYIAMFIMFVVSISIISGFLATSASIEKTVNEESATYCAEDGQFTVTQELTEEQIAEVEKQDITVYRNYFIDHELEEEKTIRYYQIREEVNLLSLMSGELPVNTNEAAIERVFAVQNKIEIGDTLDGYKITGMFAVPDYTSLYESNNDIMLNTSTFGIMMVTPETFEEVSGKVTYNYAYRLNSHLDGDTTNPSKKEQYELISKITKTLYQNGCIATSAYSADMNQAMAFLKDDMGSDVPMMKVLLFIILFVIAFVFTILTNHTIDSESVIIGTLLSNGNTKWEILRHYMILPTLVTLLGGAVGNLIGYTAFVQPFINLYYNTYSIPWSKIEFNTEAFLLTTVTPIVIVVIITFLGIIRKLSISPLKFLRKDLKRSGKKGATKLPNFKFLTRFRMRILFQNMGSYLVLFFGIFFASFLLLFGIGMLPLMDTYAEKVDDTLFAKNQYILEKPFEVEGADKTTVVSLALYSNTMKKNIEVTLYGMDEYKGEKLEDGRIIVASALLKKEKMKTQTELVLTNEYTEKEYRVTPNESMTYYGGFAIVMNRTSLNELMDYDSEYYNGYLSDTLLDIDDEYVDRLITEKDMTKVADQMVSSMSGMVPMFIVVAVVIYFVLMYILTKLTIDKNALCISFMKVFGYRNQEVRKLYLHGGTLTVVLSLIICVPLEYVGLQLAMDFVMMKISGYLDAALPWYIYAEVALTGLVTYAVINAILVRHVNKIPMTDALKTRE